MWFLVITWNFISTTSKYNAIALMLKSTNSQFEQQQSMHFDEALRINMPLCAGAISNFSPECALYAHTCIHACAWLKM